METLQSNGPFNIQDLSAAPSLPGLYVWYARLAVGRADWHSEYAGSESKATEHLMNALKAQSLKFGSQEMKIAAAANFSSAWRGTLKEDQLSKWRIGDNNETAQDGFGNRLQNCLRENSTRQALVAFIDNAFPIFCAPLYVGKAAEQTLSDRLRQHRRSYLRLWNSYRKDPQLPEKLKRPKNFAERAIKFGFTPDDLYCFTLSFDVESADGLSAEDGTSLINTTEWLLNGWATPVLGRK